MQRYRASLFLVDSPGPRIFADLAPALESLPLFPLPQTVLFPGALLPLHVFEPRYRALIRDVLKTHRTLSVALISDLAALDEGGHPPIADVAGVGVIIDHADLPGGRYNILLRGRARVKLRELPFEPPYRRAAATLLEAPAIEVPQNEVMALVSTATAFVSVVRERDSSFDFHLPRDMSPSLLADICAHHLVLDARERQAILETLDTTARVRRVAHALAVQRLALSGEPREMN